MRRSSFPRQILIMRDDSHCCLVSMATHKERYWRYWILSTPCSTFVNNDYSRYRSVSSMLTDLNWPSLQSRRRICDLVCFIKYMIWRSSQHPPSLWPHLRACVWQYEGQWRPSSSVDAYNFFLMKNQSPYETSCQLTLLVLSHTQNSSEESLLI